MNRQIFKYPLTLSDWQELTLPIGAEILSIQVQNELPYLWVLVDPNEVNFETRQIEVYGTGHIIGYDMGVERKHLSTFQMYGGDLVFHAFERLS